MVEDMKKVAFHGHELDKENLAYELGDLMFYIARMAEALGYSLSQITTMNIEKLMKRYPVGFSKEASINRSEGY
ncbi:MazG nucleotide pyrophosphohydrolase domain-containing protein [Peribacillus glennii]|uniref:MazG nucleotide pyrophosphohydrolase domain-containing protein n=1 Tax=Peribacillus glennii TaxID=2303991 RepID=UPI00227901BC|nr:MazG nucleotide pyrophosphohydrolase domain-containing protein [Peribacillus glennii]